MRFLRYPGGKTRLISKLIEYLPKFKNTFMVKFPHWEKELENAIYQIIRDLK